MEVPASALIQWSALAFGDDVATRVFEPLLADWVRDVEAAPSTPARRSAWLRGAAAFAGCTLRVGTTAAWPRREDRRHLAGSLAAAGGFLALGATHRVAQTPEFSAAAVWCALGLAIRPRSDTASRPMPLQRR